MTANGYLGDLRAVLRGRSFRRLFAVRLTSQLADGVLQVGLAAFVFFSPERSATAGSAAAAFATLLLPFSLVGPFVGVLLDRWRRRQVLVVANAIRTGLVLTLAALVGAGVDGAAFFVLALLTLGVNRFFLAALGASLPRVVPAGELVVANAVSPTSGTIAAMLGAGLAYGVRELTGATAATYVLCAALTATAAALALRLGRSQLGPDVPVSASSRSAVPDVLRGLGEGAAHVGQRRPAAWALAMVVATRFAYGLATVVLLLLFRNTFNDPADTDAGLGGLALALGVSGAGFFLAAVATPAAVRRLADSEPVGRDRWIGCLLVLAAVVLVVPAALFRPWAMYVSALGLGFALQGVKICVDTIVQTQIDDGFRGRVFAFYDVLFNVAFVAAACLGALVLPSSGRSLGTLLGTSGLLAFAAYAYTRAARDARRSAPEARDALTRRRHAVNVISCRAPGRDR